MTNPAKFSKALFCFVFVSDIGITQYICYEVLEENKHVKPLCRIQGVQKLPKLLVLKIETKHFKFTEFAFVCVPIKVGATRYICNAELYHKVF